MQVDYYPVQLVRRASPESTKQRCSCHQNVVTWAACWLGVARV